MHKKIAGVYAWSFAIKFVTLKKIITNSFLIFNFISQETLDVDNAIFLFLFLFRILVRCRHWRERKNLE